jgi:hypothetical protein
MTREERFERALETVVLMSDARDPRPHEFRAIAESALSWEEPTRRDYRELYNALNDLVRTWPLRGGVQEYPVQWYRAKHVLGQLRP